MSVSFVGPPDQYVENGLSRHKYARVGQSFSFEARPAIMHFGGFRVGELHSMKLRLINASKRSQRMHILPPTTQYFRIRYDKAGVVAPGMVQVVEVIFAPTEWRYYYDSVRVHTEEENLQIPIHGYPVVNHVSFPKTIDFGMCQIRQTLSRTVRLGCDAPVQFEYELDVLQSHPEFTVSPLKGIIPANGDAAITVEFTPVTLGTATMALRVNVSQFNFESFVCNICASTVADLQATMTGPAPGRGVGSGAQDALPAPPTEESAAEWGTFAADSKNNNSSNKYNSQSLVKSSLTTSQHQLEPPQQDTYAPAPDTLKLTRRPKRRRHRQGSEAANDDAVGHDQNGSGREDSQALADASARSARNSGGATSASAAAAPTGMDPSMTVTMNTTMGAGRTTASLMRSMTAPRTVKANEDIVGEELLTPEEIEAILIERAQLNAERARAQRQAERERGHVQVFEPPSRVILPSDEPDLLYPRPGVVNNAVFEAPTFEEEKNDLWSKRRRLLARLVASVSKQIIRTRAKRRFDAVLPAAVAVAEARRRKAEEAAAAAAEAASAGVTNRESTSAILNSSVNVALPRRQNGPSSADADGVGGADEAAALTGTRATQQEEDVVLGMPRFTVSVKDVRRYLMPLYVEETSQATTATTVEVNEPRKLRFDDLTVFSLRTGMEADEMGYQIHCFALSPMHFRSARDRWPRRGALEEGAVRPPRGLDTVKIEGATSTSAQGDSQTDGDSEEANETQKPALCPNTVRAPLGLFGFTTDSQGATVPDEQSSRNAIDTRDVQVLYAAEDAREAQKMSTSLDERNERAGPASHVEVTLEDTLRRRLERQAGTGSLIHERDTPCLWDLWRPSTQRVPHALHFTPDQAWTAPWEVFHMPAKRTGPQDEDYLTDSESEDEDDAAQDSDAMFEKTSEAEEATSAGSAPHQPPLPTFAMACALFQVDDEAGEEENAEDGGDENASLANSTAVGGGATSRAASVTVFETAHDRNVLEMERHIREQRECRAQALTDILTGDEGVSTAVTSVAHRFLLQPPAHLLHAGVNANK